MVIVSPCRKRPDRWLVKTRLGLAAPEGLSLEDLGIEDFDPSYGGVPTGHARAPLVPPFVM